MFLNILTPEQQRLYLRAARALLEAGGAVASAEATLLEAARVECAVDDLPELTPVSELLERAPSVLDSQAARNVFLLELAGAMVIDGEASSDEITFVAALADVLDVGKEDVGRFLAFAERGRELVIDGQRLIAGEGTS